MENLSIHQKVQQQLHFRQISLMYIEEFMYLHLERMRIQTNIKHY